MTLTPAPGVPARLAFVITELEVGGAERCLTNLVLGLHRERFSPVVYSLWGRPDPERSELVNRLESAGVPLRFINLRRAWQLRHGIRQLHRFLREQQPQLIQTFLFHANILGAYAGWQLRVPHVVQGMRVADRSLWRMMMERTAARFVERIVCVSESVKQFALDEVRLPSEKLCVIPNGIEVEKYHVPATDRAVPEWGLPAGRRMIAVIGRLHAQKGVDWLLRLAPDFLAQLPDVDLMIAGTGPEESSLQELAASLEIASRVHFLGWQKDVVGVLSRASLLVLPSRWEGMPNVVLEAMAAGLPVVATQVEGVQELLGPNPGPQLTPPDDGVHFSRAIIQLLQDSRLAQELGRANQARARAEFALPQMVDRYERLYRNLLEGC